MAKKKTANSVYLYYALNKINGQEQSFDLRDWMEAKEQRISQKFINETAAASGLKANDYLWELLGYQEEQTGQVLTMEEAIAKNAKLTIKRGGGCCGK